MDTGHFPRRGEANEPNEPTLDSSRTLSHLCVGRKAETTMTGSKSLADSTTYNASRSIARSSLGKWTTRGRQDKEGHHIRCHT